MLPDIARFLPRLANDQIEEFTWYVNHFTYSNAIKIFCYQMFLASTLNIQFRKSDYAGLAVISTLLGLGAACWFATGLLGITLVDIAAVWENIKVVMVEAMSHTPPDWPMVIS